MKILIIILGVLSILMMFIIRYYYRKGWDLVFFYKKYDLNKYDGEFLERRLEHIANDSSPFPADDKIKALRSLKLYREHLVKEEAKSEVDLFINKYGINTDGDVKKIYDQLKKVAANVDNPSEDIIFAKDMIKDIEDNRFLHT